MCYVEPEDRRVTFVGARFDLFVVNGDHVEQVRSGKKGIGYPEVPVDQVFDASVIEASAGTRFYMTTDGAVDQISQTDRRRFGKKRFIELIKTLQDKPMSAQGPKILEAITAHQGAAPRLDDIAVVGFNIG